MTHFPKRRLVSTVFVVIALVTVSFVASAGNGTPVDHSAKPMDLAIIGDVPYGGSALARFPALIDAINDDAKVRAVVHVGDIKSGSTQCTDEWFWEIRAQFDTFKDPLIYSIGDNEWTDCHRANNGGYDPIDRLDALRDIFFDVPGTTLGGRMKRVDAQPNYPENQLWMESRVAFAALHVVGSNNNLLPWFGLNETDEQEATRLEEYNHRNAANIAWLERTFDLAVDEDAAGVALFLHADMWHPADRDSGREFDGHQDFVQRLAELAEDFGKPVLLVSGDSHNLRIDDPVDWFSLYSAPNLDNVTQIIIDRSIEGPPGAGPANSVWLRLHVDPRSSQVFSWEEVPVE